jgi:hypothetical protein
MILSSHTVTGYRAYAGRYVCIGDLGYFCREGPPEPIGKVTGWVLAKFNPEHPAHSQSLY